MSDTASYTCLKDISQRRRSIRNFLDKPVSKEDIRKILDIAATAPYASVKKNWYIQVVDDRATITRLAETVKTASQEVKKNLKPDFRAGFSRYAESFGIFQSAPLLFIPVFRVARSLTLMRDDEDLSFAVWERDNYVKSISCVSMLILLAAESLGLGSCYMTGPLIAEPEIRKLLDIDSEVQVGAIIPVGYYDKNEIGETTLL